MNHLTDEQLVDCYYGEANAHLDVCEACRVEFENLQLTLDSVRSFRADEPGPNFEADLWEGIREEIAATPPLRAGLSISSPARQGGFSRDVFLRQPLGARPGSRGRVLMLIGTVAAMLVVAFLAGRATKPAPQVARERIPVLVVAVGDHLERLEAVFVELENASAHNGKVDISFEQSSAEDLLDSNRLYRQTAVASGDLATASVLEDLENSLLDIAHQPGKISVQQLEELRSQISERGVLFKARVLGSRLRLEQVPKEKQERKENKS